MLVELNAYLAFFVGLVMLSVCGDWLVTGAARLGKIFRLSAVFIGVCIIGFGTSLPEMLATVSAATKGASGLALGNVIGSNIANIGLIMAVGLLLTAGHIVLDKARGDYYLMVAATAAFVGAGMSGDLTWPVGVAFLAGLAASIWLSMRLGQKHYSHEINEAEDIDLNLTHALLLVAMGLLGLFAGAEQLVKSAIVIAQDWGVPDKVIGLTMVAIGTSLPELAATLSAARRGESDMIVGNILGSNIFNLLGAAAAGSLFAKLETADMHTDLMVMSAFTCAMAPLFILRNPPLRLAGVVFVAAYLGYVGYTALMAL
ncbi:MAG: calcium/sodium antiporter [Proteobacteria bacterium]|nr:calcium/sodium antiporter [Pseudomonadota bacterium]